MDNILAKIEATKKVEVLKAKRVKPLYLLEQQIGTVSDSTVSLVKSMLLRPGVIAEFKRASPSKGIINDNVSPSYIAKGYAAHASAISVLTDKNYFQAKKEDFSKVRQEVNIPLLRKEFIIDEYQIYESRAMGADIILLIAAMLSKSQIKAFTSLAHAFNLEVLIELHHPNELSKLCGNEDIIGVNNRNLKTFEVNIAQSIMIKKELGSIRQPLISESGLSSITEVEHLVNEGFQGFLMGEYFMKQANPIDAFNNFINLFKEISK